MRNLVHKKVMAICDVLHLGDESTRQITHLVLNALGPSATMAEWSVAHGGVLVRCTCSVLVLIVECEQPDGAPCATARKFLRELRRSDAFAHTNPKVACLALARSVCANSAAMLGDDKWAGAAKIQRALVDKGCTTLVKMGGAEIELEAVETSVLPWAQQVREALDATADKEDAQSAAESLAARACKRAREAEQEGPFAAAIRNGGSPTVHSETPMDEVNAANGNGLLNGSSGAVAAKEEPVATQARSRPSKMELLIALSAAAVVVAGIVHHVKGVQLLLLKKQLLKRLSR